MAREPKIESKKIRIAADAPAETAAPPAPPLEGDPDLIRDLARLLDETGLTEIEFERDGARVRVARHATAPPPPAPMALAPTDLHAPPATASAGGDPASHPGVL